MRAATDVTPGLTRARRAATMACMSSNPRGDTGSADTVETEWHAVLAHRQNDPEGALEAAIARLSVAGLTPHDVEAHLIDGGDALYAAATSGDEDWAEAFGGSRAVALLAAEVSALMSHLVARAAGVRALGIAELLDDYSAVTVARELGVARQKVYGLARSDLSTDFIPTTPWRTS